MDTLQLGLLTPALSGPAGTVPKYPLHQTASHVIRPNNPFLQLASYCTQSIYPLFPNPSIEHCPPRRHPSMSHNANSNEVKKQFTHLAILCCHAVYHGTSGSDPRKEENWALKPFQRGTDTKSGEHETFLQHAFAAVQLQNDHTLVAFSGGPTDEEYPDLSEAQSYVNAFKDWSEHIGLSMSKDILEDILLEDAATDSYQNVVFSILAFRRRTGYYPRHLIIITHAFKNARFLRLHAKALRWPVDRVKVLGINPPFTGM